MAPSTFHSFPRLPAELRLQIWNETCFPFTKFHYGIQYIDIRDKVALPLYQDWSRSVGEGLPSKHNRSAFLISGGLWKACKESREVIIKHSHYEDWLRINEREVGKSWHLAESKPDWPGGEEADHPARIKIREGLEEWIVLCYPSRDIFCIKKNDWKSAHRSARALDICTSLVQCQRENLLSSTLLVGSFALEFDQSWNAELPNDMFALQREESARGYLIYLAIEYWKTKGLEGPWIIDKNAKWYRDFPPTSKALYQDCNEEYVEVDWRDVPQHSGDGVSLNASAFIEKASNLDSDWDGHCPECYDTYGWLHGFCLRDSVRLLVCRDNGVYPPTMRCKDKCNDMGWCICSENEDERWEE